MRTDRSSCDIRTSLPDAGEWQNITQKIAECIRHAEISLRSLDKGRSGTTAVVWRQRVADDVADKARIILPCIVGRPRARARLSCGTPSGVLV